MQQGFFPTVFSSRSQGSFGSKQLDEEYYLRDINYTGTDINYTGIQ